MAASQQAVAVRRRGCALTRPSAPLQAKNENSTNGQARWPKKSAVFLLNLLKNAESNAEVRSVRTLARSSTELLMLQTLLAQWSHERWRLLRKAHIIAGCR